MGDDMLDSIVDNTQEPGNNGVIPVMNEQDTASLEIDSLIKMEPEPVKDVNVEESLEQEEAGKDDDLGTNKEESDGDDDDMFGDMEVVDDDNEEDDTVNVD